MKRLLSLFAVALAVILFTAVPAQAVAVTVISIDERLAPGGEIVFNNGFALIEVPYAQFTTESCAFQARELEELLQDRSDDRVLLNGLTADDPDRYVDPGMATLFWSDIEGDASGASADKHWLTGRNVIWEIDCDLEQNFIVTVRDP